MAAIIVFNNKGGVGKTTFTCNLAAHLAKNHKVVVIDADPQTNSTIYTLPTIEDEFQSTLDTILSNYRDSDTGDMSHIVTKSIVASERFGFDVIQGDPDLCLLEDLLSKDWTEAIAGDARGLRNSLVFRYLSRILKSMGYDYIFFDVGPSLGAINRAILTTGDYMIIPMSIDRFNIKGLKNIRTSLDRWSMEANRGLEIYQTKNKKPFKLHDRELSLDLKFIGYVIQEFMSRSAAGAKVPVKAFGTIITDIHTTIVDTIVPMNNASPGSSPLSNFAKGRKINTKTMTDVNYLLGEIPMLNSLIPLSQTANCPIFKLTTKDGAAGGSAPQKKKFDDIMTAIVKNLIINEQLMRV